MRTGLCECAGLFRIGESAEEGVGQRDGVDVRCVRILGDCGVDPEAERELHLLAGCERLLVEVKQAVLWKYLPTVSGVTLYSATPVMGVLASLRAV